MVLEKLSSGLRSTIDKVRSALFVDDTLVGEIVKDIQRSLLSADVNVKLVFELTERIKTRIKSEPTPTSLSKKDHVVSIIYSELVAFVGDAKRELDTSRSPSFIMLVGLFGSGKTTTAGKLARYYKNRGFKVAAVQTDTWRPAAFEQLRTLCSQAGVDFYGIEGEKDPVAIFERFADRYDRYDVVIVDSAGRDALSDDLIDEISRMRKRVDPTESLLVISADLGQSAQKQAETFNEAVNVTGVIITKMDGTARAGGALSACAKAQAPVVFIGTGERIADLESFDPKGFIGRLLGMGDLSGLLERAQEAFTEEEAMDMSERLMSGEFTLEDLYEQMASVRKMGSFSKVLEMVPGMGQLKLPKEALDVQEQQLDKWRYIIDSMTPYEREHPDVVSVSRIERISNGSGTEYADVRGLLKQYKQAKKMSKMLKGGSEKKIEKLMRRMGSQMPR